VPFAGSEKFVHVIAGPTASGKSARALDLADWLGGVIVNADSVQLYDALPILSAAPSLADRRAAPHRLYGVLSPQETCSARQWRDMALREIEDAHAAGQVPLLVGGTGFYLRALTHGFSPIPDIPPEFRSQGATLQAQLGNPGFHSELAARDPLMAARLHPQDTQRLIRAWEVLAFTGRSLAHWQAQDREGPPEGLKFTYEILLPERKTLYGSCDRRFDAMLKAGALDEAACFDEAIRAGVVAHDAPPTRALGFRELQAHLRGRMSLEEAVLRAKARTRQYAKRQTTWLRGQMSDVLNRSDGINP
jgi:tRNA dimethylallyltransferase